MKWLLFLIPGSNRFTENLGPFPFKLWHATVSLVWFEETSVQWGHMLLHSLLWDFAQKTNQMRESAVSHHKANLKLSTPCVTSSHTGCGSTLTRSKIWEHNYNHNHYHPNKWLLHWISWTNDAEGLEKSRFNTACWWETSGLVANIQQNSLHSRVICLYSDGCGEVFRSWKSQVLLV